MKRALIVLLFLAFARIAGATHVWSQIDAGDPNNAYQQVHTITQPSGQRLLFVRNLTGGLLLFKEIDADSGQFMFAQNLGAPGFALFQVVPILEDDGRVIVFARGSDQRLYYRAQIARNEPFQGWVRYSEAFNQNFTVARNRDGRLEVFTIENGTLMSEAQIEAGSAAGDRREIGGGGTLATHVAANINENGKLQVFVIGSDRQLYSATQEHAGSRTYVWTIHSQSNPPVVHELTTSRLSDGRIAVFTLRGNERSILVRMQDLPNSIGFSGTKQLFGSGLRNGFRATTTAGDQLSVYVVGQDTKIYSTQQILTGDPLGPWTNWPFAGRTAWSIAVAPRANNTVDIFAIDTNNRLVMGRQ